jgi:hypothetical protein
MGQWRETRNLCAVLQTCAKGNRLAIKNPARAGWRVSGLRPQRLPLSTLDHALKAAHTEFTATGSGQLASA